MIDLQTRDERMRTVLEDADRQFFENLVPVAFFVVCAFCLGVIVGALFAANHFEKRYLKAESVRVEHQEAYDR